MNGVVPVAVPGLAHQMQRFQLLVRDTNLGGIGVGIGDSGNPQPSGGRGARYRGETTIAAFLGHLPKWASSALSCALLALHGALLVPETPPASHVRDDHGA